MSALFRFIYPLLYQQIINISNIRITTIKVIRIVIMSNTKKSESEPSLKKNFALSTVYQVLLLLVPFITTPYVSRVLTADGVGIYSFTNSIQLYFSMFAALGTVSYGAREIARSRHNKQKRSKLFWEIETLTVITTIACLILWLVFIGIVRTNKIYYLILTLNLLATMLDISWFYTGMENLKYTVVPNSICKILGVIAIFTLVNSRDDLALYILILMMVMVLGNAAMWFYLPKFVERPDFKNINIAHHFKETLIYFIPTIATSVYTVLDKTLIGLITNNASENGYYEQATKIINMAKSLTFTSLNTLLGSRISLLFAQGEHEEIKQRINTSIDYIMFMGTGMCLGIIGVAPRFVPVFFGEGYDPVVQLLYYLSPLIMIIGISNCLGFQYYTPAGLRALSAKFIIAGSVVNLVLNILLIPSLNSFGAVIATLAAESVITILYMHYCNGFLSYGIIAERMWKKIIAGAVMLLCIRVLDPHISSNIVAVIIEVICGVIMYCLVLLLLKDSFIKVAGEIFSNLIGRKQRKKR